MKATRVHRLHAAFCLGAPLSLSAACNGLLGINEPTDLLPASGGAAGSPNSAGSSTSGSSGSNSGGNDAGHGAGGDVPNLGGNGGSGADDLGGTAGEATQGQGGVSAGGRSDGGQAGDGAAGRAGDSAGGRGDGGQAGDSAGGHGGLPDDPEIRCDIEAPFDLPTLVPGINDFENSTDSAWMSPDGRSLYVSRLVGGTDTRYDLCFATRSETNAPFGPCTKLANVNSASSERFPILSADLLSLFFQSNRVSGGNDYDIFVAKRATLSSDFGEPLPVSIVNTLNREELGSLSQDGSVLYFASSNDLMRTSMSSPAPITELNSEFRETHPVVRRDELALYFSRDVSAQADIYFATRATTAETFGTPELVPELSSIGEDYPVWLSDDQCMILVGSNRIHGNSTYELYIAKRPSL